MNAIQNQIKRTLSAPESIGYVRELLERDALAHRSELAAQVCERFDFHDARGRAQMAGCLKALRELEGRRHFTLPAGRTPPRRNPSPRRLSEPVPSPREVPPEAGELKTWNWSW